MKVFFLLDAELLDLVTSLLPSEGEAARWQFYFIPLTRVLHGIRGAKLGPAARGSTRPQYLAAVRDLGLVSWRCAAHGWRRSTAERAQFSSPPRRGRALGVPRGHPLENSAELRCTFVRTLRVLRGSRICFHNFSTCKAAQKSRQNIWIKRRGCRRHDHI